MLSPYFPPSRGGVQHYVMAVARELRAEGHDVRVLTTTGDLAAEDRPWVRSTRRTRTISNTPVGLDFAYRIHREIKQFAPDVVNGHLPVPGLADIGALCRAGVPFVTTYHNDLVKPSGLGQSAARLYNRYIGRRTLARSAAIIATSRAYAEASPYLRPWLEKVRYAAPGVDPQVYNRTLRETVPARSASGGPMLLFVGGLAAGQEHKGLQVLLESMRQIVGEMPPAHLVVVGEGSERCRYEAQARALGLAMNVTFTGRLEESELARLYGSCDAFVFPSLDQCEGFGMAILEAGACGAPIVASAVGGVPEAVRQAGGGLLVTPSVDSIAAGVLTMLRRGPLERMEAPAVTWRSTADHTLRAYEEVTA